MDKKQPCEDFESFKKQELRDSNSPTQHQRRFFNFNDVTIRDRMHIHPYAVWTGSFNFTRNATMSFENAVVLYDPNIVHAYYDEYGQIVFLSESLDWTKSWMNPNYHFIAPYT